MTLADKNKAIEEKSRRSKIAGNLNKYAKHFNSGWGVFLYRECQK